jgi:PAS domain S-box-containing protein
LISAELPENEEIRLRALEEYEILDTETEAAFDELTLLASRICGVPIALVSLIDTHRQWFKSHHGLAATETPREMAFCAHAILEPQEDFVVPNAAEDKRFHDNPLVTGDPHVQFYAGIPLVTPGGLALGTLCVIDHVPRTLTAEQLSSLRIIGRQVMTQMELRLRLKSYREAQQSLASYLSLLNSVMDSTEMSIIATSPTGIIDLFNKGAELMLGYAAPELIGKNSPAILHDPEEVARVTNDLNREFGMNLKPGFETFIYRARLGESDERQWTYIRKDGTRLKVLLSVTAMRDSAHNVTGYLGIAKDITASLELENQVRSFFEHSQNPMCVAGFDGLFIRANPIFEKLVGIGSDSLVTTPYLMLIHPEDQTKTMDALRQLAEKSTMSVTLENRIKSHDGSYRWVLWSVSTDSEGQALYVSGNDIMDRRILEESQAKYVEIVRSSADAIISMDLDGNILSWNPAAEKLLGYTAVEILGRSRRIIAPDEDPNSEVEILKILREGQTLEPFETVRRRSDGQNIHISLHVSPIFDHSGQFIGTSRIMRDISARKELDRMKSQFISTVSHELRTPLTSISGALGLLVGGVGGQLPDKAANLIQLAHKNSGRLTTLINDILDIEKIEAGEMRFRFETIKLESICKQNLETLQSYAEKYQVSYRFENSTPVNTPIRVDPDRFSQVLANLLSNAAKFSPPGASVILRVEQVNGNIVLSVIDFGRGISPEFLPRLFQRFAQEDAADTRAKGGSGLGLSISRALMERMSGTLAYIPGTPNGSIFQITMPVAVPAVIAQSSMPDAPREIDAEIPVLVVEDDIHIGELLKTMLEIEGCNVTLAATGTEALKLLATTKFAAMTLDIDLPDINGVEIIRRIRLDEIQPDLPVIIISASIKSDQHAEIDGMVEVIDFLGKPIDQVALRRAVSVARRTRKDNQIRVLHVEDDDSIQQIVKAILAETAAVTQVGSISAAKILIQQDHFDIIILDLTLADGNGLELLPVIRTHAPETPVVIFSATDYGNDRLADEINGMIKANITKSKISNSDFTEVFRNIIVKHRK